MSLLTTVDKGVGPGGQFTVSHTFPATPVDHNFWIAPFACTVVGITFRPIVTAASATLDVKKVPSGTAVASGTTLLSAAFALDGTTATNQVGALTATAADRDLAAGDALGSDVTGTTTNATGTLTVTLVRK